MTELKKLVTLVYHGFEEIDRRCVESNQQFQDLFTENSARPAVAGVFCERPFLLTNIFARSAGRLSSDDMEWNVLHSVRIRISWRMNSPHSPSGI